MKVNILFPVLNEHLRLENGIRKTEQYLRETSPVPYQITILDNGSDDDTPEIGKSLARELSHVEYVRIEQRGVGIAFRIGVERSDADLIGTMDIDLSTDITNVKKTIDLFLSDPSLDYVNASRFSKDSVTKGRKWYREITSAGLLAILKTVFHMKATDAICGFTFVRKEKALQLVKECYPDNGWFYMIEFLLRAERDNMNILDLPVKWQEDYNSTVHVWKTITNYLKNIARLQRDFRKEDKNAKKN
jgi:glycosyltransferase involved in cell wall biosynthesis